MLFICLCFASVSLPFEASCCRQKRSALFGLPCASFLPRFQTLLQVMGCLCQCQCHFRSHHRHLNLISKSPQSEEISCSPSWPTGQASRPSSAVLFLCISYHIGLDWMEVSAGRLDRQKVRRISRRMELTLDRNKCSRAREQSTHANAHAHGNGNGNANANANAQNYDHSNSQPALYKAAGDKTK